jgi:hypothetical protein
LIHDNQGRDLEITGVLHRDIKGQMGAKESLDLRDKRQQGEPHRIQGPQGISPDNPSKGAAKKDVLERFCRTLAHRVAEQVRILIKEKSKNVRLNRKIF